MSVWSGEIFKQRSEWEASYFWDPLALVINAKESAGCLRTFYFSQANTAWAILHIRRSKYVYAMLQVFRNAFSHIFLHKHWPEALSMSPCVNPCVNRQTPFLPCCIAPCSASPPLIPPDPWSTLLALGPGSWPASTSSLVLWLWLGSMMRMQQQEMRGQEEWDVGVSIPWAPTARIRTVLQLPSSFSDPFPFSHPASSQWLLHPWSFKPSGENSSLPATPHHPKELP